MGVSYALPSTLPFETARRPERTTSEPFVDDPAISDGDLIRRVARRDAYAFETLPENEREVIELAYYGGLSQSEVADFLNIPLGTVKTRTRSGLGRLADQLEGELR